MTDDESVFDRAHRLEHERAQAQRRPDPDDLASRLARIETLLVTLLHELRALASAPRD
jgi:hypothetical protein